MVFGPDDLIIRKGENGKYSAGGFNISNIINSNTTPCVTLGTSQAQTGGGIGNIAILDKLKDLAVPAGLLYLQQSLSKNYLENDKSKDDDEDKDDTVSSNLYDKLFNLASLSASDKPSLPSKKSITRKKSKSSTDNKKTRKQRK